MEANRPQNTFFENALGIEDKMDHGVVGGQAINRNIVSVDSEYWKQYGKLPLEGAYFWIGPDMYIFADGIWFLFMMRIN